MKKASLLMVALIAIVTGFACDKQPATLDEALTMAAQNGKPVLIDFYTEW
ncbi:MAG: hypothetical protein GY839_03650 [candidate division Zixibacteria bacterium]|nr:hypothetical protein [candidate division Zixibacteria bacterium]